MFFFSFEVNLKNAGLWCAKDKCPITINVLNKFSFLLTSEGGVKPKVTIYEKRGRRGMGTVIFLVNGWGEGFKAPKFA